MADKETSGKQFWIRYKKEKKEFEKKIYLHEKVDDFKKYFHAKSKLQEGELDRKIFSTPEDYVAFKAAKAKQKGPTASGSNNLASSS